MLLHEAIDQSLELRDVTFTLDRSVTLAHSISLEKCQLIFTTTSACLVLQGPGPFSFSETRFTHETSLAPVMVRLMDGHASFSHCEFSGANGGTEELLACAISLSGHATADLDHCALSDNDLHLELTSASKAYLNACQLTKARADAVRASGQTRLDIEDSELIESGWNGLVLSGDATLNVRGSRLSTNGCHGLWATDHAQVISYQNSFTSNRQHGALLSGSVNAILSLDHLAANDLCGLDASELARGLLREVEAYGNDSHGVQLREKAACSLQGCRLGDNSGSGLALFDESSAQATKLVAESNELNGIQSGGQSRLTLDRSEVIGNTASGIALFGNGWAFLDHIILGDCLGYGVQASNEAMLYVTRSQIHANGKGGALLAAQCTAHLLSSTITDNTGHGVAVSERAALTLQHNTIRDNTRDGVILLGSGRCIVAHCQLISNGRHGLLAASSAQPLLVENTVDANQAEPILLEADSDGPPSLEEAGGVTLSDGEGRSLTLPFQPKPIEECLLKALLRHGRLSEAALGKVAKSRRVGGAMENLIARLNQAGLPVLRHDGQGPEGNVYALKLDTPRVHSGFHKPASNDRRQIC